MTEVLDPHVEGTQDSLLAVTLKSLEDHRFTHLVTIANHETEGLRAAFASGADRTMIAACREGEGVALACGLVAAGAKTVLCMENLGLFECLDSLRGLPCVMKVPLPIFVGYHGRGVEPADAFDQVGGLADGMVLAGSWTVPVLEAVGMAHAVLMPGATRDEVAGVLDRALTAQEPFVVLVDNFESE